MKKRPPANIMHGGPLVICKWYAGLYGLNGVWISSDLVMKTLWRCVKWSLWRQVCIRESVNSTSRNYNERCLKCEVGVMEWIYVFRSCNEDFVKSEVCEDKFEYLPLNEVCVRVWNVNISWDLVMKTPQLLIVRQFGEGVRLATLWISRG